MNKSLSRYYARKIWEAHHQKKIPKGKHLHHIDGDCFNNDISNLIVCTPEEHIDFHRKLGDKIQPKFIARANFFETMSPEEQQKFREKASEYGCRSGSRKWTAKQIADQVAKMTEVSSPIEMVEVKTGKIIREFRSLKLASEELNIQRAHIRRVIRGQRKAWRGYVFRYKR